MFDALIKLDPLIAMAALNAPELFIFVQGCDGARMLWAATRLSNNRPRLF
ncbi:MAG TPA: hypothetical protein VG986_18345 [Pseudolabrys sp.]|nr:hypothetical protein [Pseudolabrys sp.]